LNYKGQHLLHIIRRKVADSRARMSRLALLRGQETPVAPAPELRSRMSLLNAGVCCPPPHGNAPAERRPCGRNPGTGRPRSADGTSLRRATSRRRSPRARGAPSSSTPRK